MTYRSIAPLLSSLRKVRRATIPAITACAFVAAAAPGQSRLAPDSPTCPENPDWSNYPEMRFSVRDVDGRQVLLAEGPTDDSLLPRLSAAIETFEGEEIWLRSPGGNALVGIEAGRLIRRSGLATRIPSGWACYGACNFMFMGGVTRSVDDGGYFIAQTNPPFIVTDVAPEDRQARAREIAQISAQLASADVDFLIRMGVSRALLSDIMYARSRDRSTRRCLTRAELARYNVISN